MPQNTIFLHDYMKDSYYEIVLSILWLNWGELLVLATAVDTGRVYYVHSYVE